VDITQTQVGETVIHVLLARLARLTHYPRGAHLPITRVALVIGWFANPVQSVIIATERSLQSFRLALFSQTQDQLEMRQRVELIFVLQLHGSSTTFALQDFWIVVPYKNVRLQYRPAAIEIQELTQFQQQVVQQDITQSVATHLTTTASTAQQDITALQHQLNQYFAPLVTTHLVDKHRALHVPIHIPAH
jgi:hypothetical protein